MTWQQYVLIALQVAGGLTTVAMIGKPRTPTNNATAVMTLILNAVVIAVIVSMT